MVQSGIAYAAGQLLAVVAPRTVLVVDAPTDWSLAGPLWELALDDAPVDEILDVLIRRGIRTAPSFAIVRVEADAVRALVRGSVPVCFERVGEPVRLDATGATTWLEGLISGARRVLVGAVETNTTLPYLVSTGVVLVSGLALPCGPAEPENRRNGSPGASEPGPSKEPAATPAEEDSPFTPPVPVPSSSSSSGPSGTARFSPVAGREPRVVDLTRSESRPQASPARAAFSPAPEPRDSWAMASNRSGSDRSAGSSRPESSRPELNGHVPAVLEPKPTAEPESAPERDSAPAFGSPSPFEVRSSSSESASPSSPEPPSSYRAPAAFQAPAPSAFQAPAPFAPVSPSIGDDPGELHDMDDSVLESAAPPATTEESSDSSESRSSEVSAPSEARVFSFPEADRDSKASRGSDLFSPSAEREADQDADDHDAPAWNGAERNSDTERDSASDRAFAWDSDRRPAAKADDSLDDLLIEPEDDEAPPGPAPTDLPTFEPPAVALPLPSALNGSGSGAAAKQRGFGGAPAAWPPASAVTPEAEDAPSAPIDLFAPPSFAPQAETEADYESEHSAWAPEPERQPERQQEPVEPPLPELPLRIRGRSLRPEQSSFPMDGRSSGGSQVSQPPAPVPPPPAPVQPPSAPQPPARALPPVVLPPSSIPPHSSIPPLRSLNDNHFRNLSENDEQPPAGANGHDAAPNQAANGNRSSSENPPSGGLLLPAFFRGSRTARKTGPADPPPPPPARDRNDVSATPPSGPIPWAHNGSNAAGPAAWVPPVRRGTQDESGFNGGPPEMPGVVRPLNFGQNRANEEIDDEPEAEYDGPQTEYLAPIETPSRGSEMEHQYEPPREPPRLLGVWCDAGHVTSPENGECRVCGLAVPRQAPILVARPPLGVLIFDNGDRVEVDRPVVLGRDPKAVSSPDPETPVLHAVASATGQVSRTHAEIRADGWDVVLTDLDAMNGTALTLPGASPMAIEPGVPTLITPGARVDLGGESGFVFEVEG